MIHRIFNYFFPKKNFKHNIGLYGDMDDVYLLEDVESTFSVNFSDEEAASIQTVGEFYELTEKKMDDRGKDLSWDAILKIIEPYSNIPVSEVRRDTQFFRYACRP